MKSKSVVVIMLLSLAAAASAQDRDQSARSQERITREVRHELLMLPYFGVFDSIAYKVDGSTVTLLTSSTPLTEVRCRECCEANRRR
jgi:hyperosmotically inducible protein